MSPAIDEVHIDWLIYSIPRTGDSSDLIAHIRGGGAITRALAQTIGDILEGKIKARPRKRKRVNVYRASNVLRLLLECQIESFKALLKNPEAEWDRLSSLLLLSGHLGPTDERKDQTLAAERMVAYLYGFSPSQLDEIRYHRQARPLKRES